MGRKAILPESTAQTSFWTKEKCGKPADEKPPEELPRKSILHCVFLQTATQAKLIEFLKCDLQIRR
jgi:hypothetical protein